MWSAVIQFAASLMKFITGRSEAKNAADVKAAAKANNEQEAQSATVKAVQARDLEALRREASE